MDAEGKVEIERTSSGEKLSFSILHGKRQIRVEKKRQCASIVSRGYRACSADRTDLHGRIESSGQGAIVVIWLGRDLQKNRQFMASESW